MDLKKLSKNQKIALAVGAVILIYLVYRWQTSSGSSATGTGTTGTGTTGAGSTTDMTGTGASDYASLAGQEQSDVAALQSQNQQLQAQEQSDVAALQSSVTGASGQESSDVTGLQGTLSGINSQLSSLAQPAAQSQPDLSGIQSQISAIASGVQKINRQQSATVTTHVGGPFYNYYKQVTGKAPPARVQASNFIYQAWKAGVRAAALKPAQPAAHPSAPAQTKVAHPNPTHTQQTNVSHKLPKPKPKPAAHKPAAPARRK